MTDRTSRHSATRNLVDIQSYDSYCDFVDNAGRSLGSVLLCRWRTERQLSQVKAADTLDIDQARYSKFEGGKRKPGRSLAVAIEIKTQGMVPVAAWDCPAPTAVAVLGLDKAS